MEFNTLDGGEGVKHSGIDVREISKIFLAQDTFLLEIDPFDRVYIVGGIDVGLS